MDIKKLDLSNIEDVKEFHKAVNELRENKLFSTLFGLFIDEDDVFEKLDKFADEIYAEHHKDDKKNEQSKQKEFIRPSEKLTSQQGLQIHSLVQEYVDTMIKPYNNGKLTNEQINDAYAGLYEFAAWILNK